MMHSRPRGLSFTLLVRLSLAASTVALSACATTAPPAPAAPAGAAAAAAAAAKAAVAAPPPVTAVVRFLSAAEARPALLASISLTSLDRLLGAGTALVGRAVPLPLDAASVRDMLLSQAGLVPAVGENLDFGGPAGAAVVAMGKGAASGVVFCMAAKGVAEAQRVVAALGKEVARRGDVVQVDNGSGGKGWIWKNGNVLVVSDSFDALVKGAALALEARVPGRDDITAVLYPDAIAAANGTTVKAAIGQTIDTIKKMQSATGQQVDPDALDLSAEMLGLVADTSTVEVGLLVSTSDGLRLRARMNAKPGSNLEKVAREGRPFEVDPVVLTGLKETPIFVASSMGPITRSWMARLRRRLQASHAKGTATALQFFDAMIDAYSGLGVGVAYVKPVAGSRFISSLKDAGAAGKLTAALAHLDRDGAQALVNSQLGPMGPVDVAFKRETVGKLAAVHLSVPLPGKNNKDFTAEARAAIEKLLGKKLDVYLSVAGSRLLMTMGKQAKADLTALTTGKPGEPMPGLAQQLAANKGKDTFEYIDVAPVISLITAMAKDPRVASFGKGALAPIPVVITAAGDPQGKSSTFELLVPAVTFSGVGTIIQNINGARKP